MRRCFATADSRLTIERVLTGYVACLSIDFQSYAILTIETLMRNVNSKFTFENSRILMCSTVLTLYVPQRNIALL